MKTFDLDYPSPVLGIDEVGTGAIAGPIYAAAVILPREREIREVLLEMGLQDSKKMTDGARRRVRDFLLEQNVFAMTVSMHPKRVSEWGNTASVDSLFTILAAAFRDSFPAGGTILIDGNHRKGLKFGHKALKGGDSKSLAIAAAAVMAKVARDDFMIDLADAYPGYAWEDNKGYVVPAHLEGLEKLGVTDAHRTHTKPVRRALGLLKSESSRPLAKRLGASTSARRRRPAGASE